MRRERREVEVGRGISGGTLVRVAMFVLVLLFDGR